MKDLIENYTVKWRTPDGSKSGEFGADDSVYDVEQILMGIAFAGCYKTLHYEVYIHDKCIERSEYVLPQNLYDAAGKV